MTFQEERLNLTKSYLEKSFFSLWRVPLDATEKDIDFVKKHQPFMYAPQLELIITPVCNTKCTYCYYKNHGEQLNPASLCTKENILTNLENFLKYSKKENFYYPSVEIFSGEFFKLPYYEEVIKLLDEYLPKGTVVVIPTNGTFIKNPLEVDKFTEVVSETHLQIRLSLSIDGKFLDRYTRPVKSNKRFYDEKFYEEVFKFAAEHYLHFHPMISSNHIHLWKKNLNWYLKNIKKYYKCSTLEAWRKIYLLEVRNNDWTEKDLYHYSEFVKYILFKMWKACKKDTNLFVKTFVSQTTSNFLSFLNTTNRGFGCTLQKSFALRLSDSSVVMCHRTSYKGFETCKLDYDCESNLEVTPINPILSISVNSYNPTNGAGCINCDIKNLCLKYCIGASYEFHRDLFTPTKNICDLFHIKLITFCKFLKKHSLDRPVLQILHSTDVDSEQYRKKIELEELLQKV